MVIEDMIFTITSSKNTIIVMKMLRIINLLHQKEELGINMIAKYKTI